MKHHPLKRCRSVAPGHKFSFKNKVYLPDTAVIDLRLALEYRKRKGAVKLHTGIDVDGYLPELWT